jgi:hypothetical protein
MPIIRISKKQIDAATKAQDAALRKNPDLRFHLEQRLRLIKELSSGKQGKSS